MIRRSIRFSLLLAALLAAGCSSKPGAPGPAITAFTATPATIAAGETATLAWTVTNASQVSIDNGVGVQSGNSVAVTPAVTTTYKLTATGPGGSATANATVTVSGAVPKPVITSFVGSPNDVPTGGTSTLTWTVIGTVASLTVGDGSSNPPQDVTGKTQLVVTPSAPTTYTLTAANPGGSATATALVSVHSPSLRLQYTDPSSATAKILLVRNAASTPNHLVLDVKVGPTAIAAFGFAMNIPLARVIPANPALNGPFNVDTSQSPPGLIPGIIPVGSNPATGAVIVGGPAMPGFISIGVAKHKTMAGDGDFPWAAGSTLFSIALNMVGSPTTGDIFKSATVAADPTFRAAAFHMDGSEAVSKADIAVGDFIISL